MKQHLASIVLLLSLGTFGWGQGSNVVFDVQKSKMELEIMRGIFKTTLTFTDRSSQNQYSRWRISDVNAFYLAGQGAIFMISTPAYIGLRKLYSTGPATTEQLAAVNKELAAVSRQLAASAQQMAREAAALRGDGSGAQAAQGANTAITPPAAPAPPPPPQPPSPPSVSVNPENSEKVARREMELEELRKRVDEYQEKARQSREELEANRKEFLQTMVEIKKQLVDVLANYGDSLTTVRPEEYINLVFATDEFDSQGTKFDVISAKKAWITDYKAGRLTLDEFRQKAIQYTE